MAQQPSDSEALARMALDASGAGVWSWDAASDAIIVDARYRDLYGFDAAQTVTSAIWQQRIVADDREPLRRRVLECLINGEHWHEEFRIRHPVRGLRWLEGFGHVRRDGSGRVLGLVGINFDVTDRVAGAEALRRSEAQLKAVVDGVIDGIVVIDARGTVQSFNRAAADIFRYAPADVVGRNVRMLMPEPDRSAHDGYIAAYLTTGVAKIIGIGREVSGRRSDGSVFPMDLGITEIARGEERLFVGVVRDITERKEAEQTTRLLLSELDHRVKNTLATVQAMAEQTLRHTDDPKLFAAGFRGRLQALARSHRLLTAGTWAGVGLHALVREQLVIGDGEDTQIRYAGAAVELRPQVAVHLGLVLHELGTNARKYGALSVPTGHLDVTWRVSEDAARPLLELAWRESGGPPVRAPQRTGFGTGLVERGIRHTLRGSVRHVFAPEGVACDITLPGFGRLIEPAPSAAAIQP